MSAGITLAKALQAFSRELGCGSSNDREALIDKIIESIEFLLFNGGGDILREWRVLVSNRRFTLPTDLDTPVKYKFGEAANSGFGTFHSSFLSYSSNGVRNCCDYYDWDGKFAISANKVATQFNPPLCGARLIATTTDYEDVGKKIMVAGKRKGMQVAPLHNGYKTSGELLTIQHIDDDHKMYSAWAVDEVTSVVKDETCSYVMLSGIDSSENFYHLSHYHPDETVPQYTEAQVFSCPSCYANCDYYIHILGRVNPSIRYVRDEDILPIDSLQMLSLLAKRVRYDESGDFNEVGILEQRIKAAIKQTVAYQQASARQVSFNLRSGGATLTNM